MESRDNLKRLNHIRVIADKIELEGFKREYKNILLPILNAYRMDVNSDAEMYDKIKIAIKKIGSIAKTYQYLPNQSALLNKYGHIYNDESDFEYMGMLYEIELICKNELEKYKMH